MEPEQNKPQKTYKYSPKPEFEARMNEILELSGSDATDKSAFWEIVHKEPVNSIRCNTIKITPSELKERLEEKGWKIKTPFESHPEIMLVESALKPGELGKTREHLLGHYYIQEISSMLPLLALKPAESDSFLDLCASPGSKTTQAAAMMNNRGILIANDNNLGRMMILAANLEKCGVSSATITKREGSQLCKKISGENFEFSKILVDAPCSGEGTLRSSPETFLMWNQNMIKKFAARQKTLAMHALNILKVGGEMVYSTCTHAPEENEEIVQHLLDNFDISIEPISLPLKTRQGMTEWESKKFDEQIRNCARIYPHDNNTEGFFICKIRKVSERRKEIIV